eukprot:Phypoly_transcript_08585.p1 GENE.Phypoly_transcript_08585~~Phypoly_transcript_08585.p1  ORF type:complete len:482 (+),score=27.99 Phypoly_transcript_08585:45-1490(+)
MQSSQALKDKGNQCFAKNDFSNALSYYTQAINVDPNNHVLYSNRSAAYLQVKDYQKALDDAHKCVQIEPTFIKGTLRLADAQFHLNQFSEALALYSSCVQNSDPSMASLANVGLQNCKIKGFYASIIKDLGVEPRYINTTKGKGLFATKDFKTGDVIFQEDSLAIALDPECPDNITCTHCMRFVEDVDAQIDRCKLKLNDEDRGNLRKCEIYKPFHCPDCGTVYCSSDCFNTAKNLYHTKLCVSPSKTEHPLNVYKNLPMVKEGPTSTTFMLVARILAFIATNLATLHQSNPVLQGLEMDSLFGPLQLFQRESLMKLQPSYDGSNLALLHSHLSQPLHLLKDAFFSGYTSLQGFIDNVITEQLFDELLGLVSLNNTTAYVLPPIFYQLKIRQPEVAHARAHGICLFTIHSCINHSCSPNAENRSTKEDRVTNAKVVLRALKPIKQGEELLITYIDETQSKANRQQELKAKYGFTCNCSRCQ